MKSIDNIKAKALRIGACDLVSDVEDFASLAKLFFSPQGREFCERHNFPTMTLARRIKTKIKPYDIYVDAGEMTSTKHRIALIGNTHAKVVAKGTEAVYMIILMHGATVEIDASNYAVIKVINISGGEVAIHKDNTTRLL